MAKPKLQIEQRLDNLEQAVRTLAQVGFGPDEVEEIERILSGKKEAPDAGPESQGRVQVREEGEDVPDEEASSQAGQSDSGQQEEVGEDVDSSGEDQS